MKYNDQYSPLNCCTWTMSSRCKVSANTNILRLDLDECKREWWGGWGEVTRKSIYSVAKHDKCVYRLRKNWQRGQVDHSSNDCWKNRGVMFSTHVKSVYNFSRELVTFHSSGWKYRSQRVANLHSLNVVTPAVVSFF